MSVCTGMLEIQIHGCFFTLLVYMDGLCAVVLLLCPTKKTLGTFIDRPKGI